MSVTRKVTVALDVDVVRQLDSAAKDAGVSRSALIAAMIEMANWSEIVEGLKYPQDDRDEDA